MELNLRREKVMISGTWGVFFQRTPVFFKSLLDTQAGWPRCYINVRHCGGLSMALLQLKEPLELFVKRREFLPGIIAI